MPSDVREKTDVELAKLVSDQEGELFGLRFRKGAGQLKQTTNIKNVRRDLARVKTIQRERALKQA